MRTRTTTRRGVWFFTSLAAGLVAPTSQGCHAHVQAEPALFKTASYSPIVVGTRPLDIALADLNDDGSLDIVTVNVASENITVLLNNGRGGFAASPTSTAPTGLASHLVAVADFDGDDTPDLAITAHASNGVAVLLGDGKGGFTAVAGSPFAAINSSSPHNHGLVLGDMNSDSRVDIVTSNSNDNSVSVLLGDGRGGFSPAAGSPFAVGRRAYMPAIGDINADGHLDVTVPNLGDATVSVLLGNGKGGLHPAPDSPLPVQQTPYCTALGDINADSALDLVVAQDDTTMLLVFLGDGAGGFRKAPAPADAGSRGYRMRLVDVNVDGRTDLITGTANGAVAVLLGNGTGGFTTAPGSPFAVGPGPWGVQVADINGDQKPDIVTSNQDNNNISILLGQ